MHIRIYTLFVSFDFPPDLQNNGNIFRCLTITFFISCCPLKPSNFRALSLSLVAHVFCQWVKIGLNAGDNKQLGILLALSMLYK